MCVFVVYTETITVLFLKPCTVKPIFKSLCFQAPNAVVVYCKQTAKHTKRLKDENGVV